MRKSVTLAAGIALLTGSVALAAPATDTGDRRGRIGTRTGDRINARVTTRTVKSWTPPVGRARSTARRTANNQSDAITYGRELAPR